MKARNRHQSLPWAHLSLPTAALSPWQEAHIPTLTPSTGWKYLAVSSQIRLTMLLITLLLSMKMMNQSSSLGFPGLFTSVSCVAFDLLLCWSLAWPEPGEPGEPGAKCWLSGISEKSHLSRIRNTDIQNCTGNGIHHYKKWCRKSPKSKAFHLISFIWFWQEACSFLFIHSLVFSFSFDQKDQNSFYQTQSETSCLHLH